VIPIMYYETLQFTITGTSREKEV